MAEDSHAFEPIRRYILIDDIKGGDRTDIIGCKDAPSKSYKKQSNRTKPQHPD